MNVIERCVKNAKKQVQSTISSIKKKHDPNAVIIQVLNKAVEFAGSLCPVGSDLSKSFRYSYNETTGQGYLYSIAYSTTFKYNSATDKVEETRTPYLKFVEFGTGIKGERGAHNPLQPLEWEHDAKKHGSSGWYYYKNGKFRKTYGMEATPIMYQTYLYIQAMLQKYNNIIVSYEFDELPF